MLKNLRKGIQDTYGPVIFLIKVFNYFENRHNGGNFKQVQNTEFSLEMFIMAVSGLAIMSAAK